MSSLNHTSDTFLNGARTDFFIELLGAVQVPTQIKSYLEKSSSSELTTASIDVSKASVDIWFVKLASFFNPGDVIDYWNTPWPWDRSPESSFVVNIVLRTLVRALCPP